MNHPLSKPMVDGGHVLDLIPRTPATFEEWQALHPNGVEIKPQTPLWHREPRPAYVFMGYRSFISKAEEQGGGGCYHKDWVEGSPFAKALGNVFTTICQTTNEEVWAAQFQRARDIRRSLAIALSAADMAIETIGREIGYQEPAIDLDQPPAD
jgi:hypothetical protein